MGANGGGGERLRQARRRRGAFVGLGRNQSAQGGRERSVARGEKKKLEDNYRYDRDAVPSASL